MKSEWEFTFEARGCHFEREHTYEIASKDPVDVGGTTLTSFDIVVKLSPLDWETPPGVDQVGKIVFTLPLGPEKCHDFAHFIAQATIDRLSFHARGDLRIRYGFVRSMRIPETPEEEAEVGDRPYSVTLRLEEIVPTPSVEASAGKVASSGIHAGLLAQFNEAARDTSPIRKFLAFFRIVESFVHRTAISVPLKKALKSDSDLRNYFAAIAPKRSFDDFVDTVVEIRHKCAHLKVDQGFGYLPTDPEIEKIVVPYLYLLEELARACVAGT